MTREESGSESPEQRRSHTCDTVAQTLVDGEFCAWSQEDAPVESGQRRWRSGPGDHVGVLGAAGGRRIRPGSTAVGGGGEESLVGEGQMR